MSPRAAVAAVAALATASAGAVAGRVLIDRPAPAPCREAIDYALDMNDASAAFAEHMADFLGAVAAGDQAAIDAAMAGLAPIEVQTTAALDGFVAAANQC